MKKSLMLPLALGLALGAGNAAAAFINGSISASGGFETLPTPPTGSIVSALTAFDVQSTAAAIAPTGDFSGTPVVATAYDFDIMSLPTNFFDTGNGFSFQLTEATISSISGLTCDAQGLCADSIAIDLTGLVSGPGFDTTAFSGSWTAQGSCIGSGSTCTNDPSASWSASLSALGVAAPPPPPPSVPEPALPLLLGSGLLGLAGLRRRKA